jgi:membrane protein YdbS with pleckstrin-like domain
MAHFRGQFLTTLVGPIGRSFPLGVKLKTASGLKHVLMSVKNHNALVRYYFFIPQNIFENHKIVF